MSTPVAHARKIKTVVGFANVVAHNTREGVYNGKGELEALKEGEKHPDWLIRPDRAHLNVLGQISTEEAHSRRRSRIRAAAEANKAAGFDWRSPQKNSCAAIELNLSASPEWFEGKEDKVVKAYFDDLKEWAEKRYGKDNLLHWSVHYDEKTPHAHAVFLPLMPAEKDKKPAGLKYSSGHFLGGRNGLSEMQTSVWKEVGQKYGLERGVEGSKARHTDQKEWLAEQHKQLEHMKEVLRKREEKAAAKEAELAKKEANLEKNMEIFKGVGAKSFEDRAASIKTNQEVTAKLERLEIKEKGVQALIDTVQDLNIKKVAAWLPYHLGMVKPEGQALFLKDVARLAQSYANGKEAGRVASKEKDKALDDDKKLGG